MAKPSRDDLAAALQRLADAIEKYPGRVIGMKVVAHGTGSGNVTGVSVSVSGGGPGSGSVTGIKISVSSSDRNPAELQLVQELRDAAQAAKAGSDSKSWIRGLIRRAADVGTEFAKGAANSAGEIFTTFYDESL